MFDAADITLDFPSDSSRVDPSTQQEISWLKSAIRVNPNCSGGLLPAQIVVEFIGAFDIEKGNSACISEWDYETY
jgi:hypothetical protein